MLKKEQRHLDGPQFHIINTIIVFIIIIIIIIIGSMSSDHNNNGSIIKSITIVNYSSGRHTVVLMIAWSLGESS